MSVADCLVRLTRPVIEWRVSPAGHEQDGRRVSSEPHFDWFARVRCLLSRVIFSNQTFLLGPELGAAV